MKRGCCGLARRRARAVAGVPLAPPSRPVRAAPPRAATRPPTRHARRPCRDDGHRKPTPATTTAGRGDVPAGASASRGVRVGGLERRRGDRRRRAARSRGRCASSSTARASQLQPARSSRPPYVDGAVGTRAARRARRERRPRRLGPRRRRARRRRAAREAVRPRGAATRALSLRDGRAVHHAASVAGRRLDRATLVARDRARADARTRACRCASRRRRSSRAVTARQLGPVIVINRGPNRLSLFKRHRARGAVRRRDRPGDLPDAGRPLPHRRQVDEPVVVPADVRRRGRSGLKPVPPGPGNPLGTRWMGLSAPGVGIHGTPDPARSATASRTAASGCRSRGRVAVRPRRRRHDRLHRLMRGRCALRPPRSPSCSALLGAARLGRRALGGSKVAQRGRRRARSSPRRRSRGRASTRAGSSASRRCAGRSSCSTSGRRTARRASTRRRTLAAAAERWAGKDVVFLGVDEHDLRGPALKFMRPLRHHVPDRQRRRARSIGHYGVTGYPETFFIDRRGRVVPPHIGIGPVVDAATELDAGIRQRARVDVRLARCVVAALALALARRRRSRASSTRRRASSRPSSSARRATRRSTSRPRRSRSR